MQVVSKILNFCYIFENYFYDQFPTYWNYFIIHYSMSLKVVEPVGKFHRHGSYGKIRFVIISVRLLQSTSTPSIWTILRGENKTRTEV